MSCKGKMPRPIRIIPDFSMETMKARRSWIDVMQTLMDRGCKPRLAYPAKLAFTSMEKTRYSMTKTDLNNMYPQTQS